MRNRLGHKCQLIRDSETCHEIRYTSSKTLAMLKCQHKEDPVYPLANHGMAPAPSSAHPHVGKAISIGLSRISWHIAV